MRHLWMRIRIPCAIIALLVIALAMARIFSGPEDTWIKNERGEWVMHGHPAGPPPATDYLEPVTHLVHLVVPLAFLVAFAAPLFFIGRHKQHNRLSFETATRDIRFYGYLSTSLLLFGILILAGLMLELVLGGTGGGNSALEGGQLLLTGVFIISLAGFAGLCIVLAIAFFVLKRNANDHYQLQRSYREIVESLGKLPTTR